MKKNAVNIRMTEIVFGKASDKFRMEDEP